MFNLIKVLTGKCIHKWKVLDQENYKHSIYSWDEPERLISEDTGTIYILQCEKCGKIKQVKTNSESK